MPDETYGPKVYMKQEGDELIVAEDGKITTEGTGVVDTSANTGGLVVAAGEIEAADLASSAVTSVKINALAVTTGKLAALAVTQAKLEEGSMVFVSKQLTNTEVLALATGSGVEIVAAPGANKSVVLHKVLLVADATAGAWVEPSAPDDLVVQYNGGADITGAIEAGVMVAADISVRTYGVLDTELTPETNVAVNLFNTGGQWTGGNAANTMSIRIWYSVIDTVAFS
jgi:hypothetical protein